jgi:hypothetical protein
LPSSATDGCAKDTDCKGDRVCLSGQCVAPAGASAATAATATAANDGTDAKNPVLALDDASFSDTRHGLGWSDRCWKELHDRKFGWALAACNKGLDLPDLDPKAKGALVYNKGLAFEGAGDRSTAKSLFEQSLALRPANDPGRAEVAAALARVGGTPSPGATAARTFQCGRVRCNAGQDCCPSAQRCFGSSEVAPDGCQIPSDRRSCDPKTNEPCDTANGETCRSQKIGAGPLSITLVCGR